MGNKKLNDLKTSKRKTGNDLGAYETVPPEIRPLVSERHILLSEDPQIYDNVFTSLRSMFSPKTVRQWLLLKDLQDSIWEKRRILRIKPGIVDSSRMQVVESRLRTLPMHLRLELNALEQNVLDWFGEPKKKEALGKILAIFGCSEAAIDGLAFVEHISEMETMEKLQLVHEAREDTLYRLLANELSHQELQHPANDDYMEPAKLTDHPGHQNEESGDRAKVEPDDESRDAAANRVEDSSCIEEEAVDHEDSCAPEGEAA